MIPKVKASLGLIILSTLMDVCQSVKDHQLFKNERNMIFYALDTYNQFYNVYHSSKYLQFITKPVEFNLGSMFADDNFNVNHALLKKLSLTKSNQQAYIQAEKNLKNDLKMNTMFMFYIRDHNSSPTAFVLVLYVKFIAFLDAVDFLNCLMVLVSQAEEDKIMNNTDVQRAINSCEFLAEYLVWFGRLGLGDLGKTFVERFRDTNVLKNKNCQNVITRLANLGHYLAEDWKIKYERFKKRNAKVRRENMNIQFWFVESEKITFEVEIIRNMFKNLFFGLNMNAEVTKGEINQFTLDAMEIGLLWRESMYFKESVFHTTDPTKTEYVHASAGGKRYEIPTYQSSAIEMIRWIEKTKLKIKLAFRSWSVKNERKIKNSYVVTKFTPGELNLKDSWTSYLLQKDTYSIDLVDAYEEEVFDVRLKDSDREDSVMQIIAKNDEELMLKSWIILREYNELFDSVCPKFFLPPRATIAVEHSQNMLLYRYHDITPKITTSLRHASTLGPTRHDREYE